MSRLKAAVLVVAFLALLAGDTGRETTAAGEPDPSARVTAGPAALGQLVVPTRPSLATTGWTEPGSSKTRPFPYDLARVTTAALLVLLVARLARRRPGPPWHHLRRHSAVLRAPPLLPLP